MPFDGNDHLVPLLQSGLPLHLMEFVRHAAQEVPGLRAEVDHPGAAGVWWIEMLSGPFSPGIEWREGTGFAIYGPGPTLPERPNAVVANPEEAARRLARMLRSWGQDASRIAA